ncbi:MAG: chitobiase/beta-hexosaminidase C-terminal domain-containing protein [Planctomycetota bacterium]
MSQRGGWLAPTLAWVSVALAFSGSAPARDLVLSELAASNGGEILDEDGEASDWFEVHNPTSSAASLEGWYATDDPGDLRKWRFPAVELAPGGYLVVFASGKDRAAPGVPLHANFRLEERGEYLALVRPDGRTVEDEYAPAYPPQRKGFSYGTAMAVETLAPLGSEAAFFVPRDGSLGLSWTLPGFAPGAGWIAGTTGIGYVSGAGGEVDPDAVSRWALDGGLADRALGNHLVYRGGTSPAWVAGHDGRVPGAVELGGSDYLEVAIADGLPIFNEPEYTVALWVKGLPQADRRVYSEGSTSNNQPLFTIGTDSAGASGVVDIFIRGPGGEDILNHRKSTRIAFDGSWHHIAWVDRNGSAALYVDGVRDGASFGYSKMALPLNVAAVGAVLRAAPSHGFTGAIDDVAVWRVALTDAEVADLASGAWTPDGNPYEGLFATDVRAALEGVNSSLYLRIPFAAADPSAFASLELRARYDDGFVAYLNGFEVARRNAPAEPAWNAAAPAKRDVRDARAWEGINLTASLGLLRPGLNVLAFQGLNSSAGDSEFLLSAELRAVLSSLETRRYFREPTPGAPNAGGFVGFVADTKFSVRRGFYDEPFLVEISTETPGATIRWTTDGSWPTASHGQVYSGPILVETTTTLRAAAFKEGYEPTNVDTQTYIFLADVLRQGANPPGYPTVWQGYPADYAMDPEIATDVSSLHYAPTLAEDLKSIPTLSLAIDRDDWMGPARGIYTHSLSRGAEWERPASIELLYPDGSEDGFHANCGVRMQGGSSARPGEGKHSFRLVFKERYGDGKLRRRLFRDSPAGEFDTIVLRCFSTDSWHFKDGGSRYRRWDSQFIRDVWMRDSQLAMGHVSSHGTYVHLYVNGMYWGIYNPSERPDEDFMVSYFGGREEDWDIVKDFNELFRGTRDSWSQLMSLANAGLGTLEAYQRVQGNDPDGTRNPSYPVLLDVDNLIDYMILHVFACAEDWPHHNWYAARNRTGECGGWRFFVWDQEIVLDFVFRDRTDVSNDNSPAKVYSSLRANPEFRLRFADRLRKHLFDGGALAVEECRKRWLRRADEIDRAVVAESARWGDYRMDVPDPSNSPAELYTREGHWLPEKAKVLGEYLPESHRLALERFRADGLYPPVEAPKFRQHGGVVPEGFELEVTAPAGTIYYTLDGSDPRLLGGQVSPRARAVGESAGGVLVASGAACRALVPVGEIPAGWKLAGFDDAAWTAGRTGVGFERSSGYEHLLGTDVKAAMDGVNCSVFVRVPFRVSAPVSGGLTLRMKYDDGFVAYLNGREVARANAPTELRWNSEASNPHPDADALVFEDFALGPAEGLLGPGENVLAIHGLNAGLTSGDMLILPELVSSESAGSGIRIDGPTVVKARAFAGSWSALTEAFFYHDIPLRVTEIMYHPPPGPEGGFFSAEDYEFLEFQNVSGRTLSLRGIRLLGGVEHEFQESLRLGPGQAALLVRNVSAFSERYPGAVRSVVGEYSGRLGNAGERIYLEGPSGEPILDFAYDDRWYPETDGRGRSLIAADALAPRERWAERAGWLPSEAAGGSPGIVEFGPSLGGGLQLPGDATQDGALDLADAIRPLLILFLGDETPPPCAGEPGSGGNLALLDANGDGLFSLSDPVYLLNYLFLGGPPPALGTDCVRIEGCPDACS